MRGFTLIEVLIALIVVAIGFGVFISVQGYLAQQALDYKEEIQSSEMASNIVTLVESVDSGFKQFKGSLAELFTMFKIPEKITVQHDLGKVFVEVSKDKTQMMFADTIIDVDLIVVEITMGSGRSFNYEFIQSPSGN